MDCFCLYAGSRSNFLLKISSFRPSSATLRYHAARANQTMQIWCLQADMSNSGLISYMPEREFFKETSKSSEAAELVIVKQIEV